MLKFCYSIAPNPMKVALFLEESALPYKAIPVNTRKGEQHAIAFTALNPGDKVLDDEARRAMFPQNERLKG
jgi:GST-like protein